MFHRLVNTQPWAAESFGSSGGASGEVDREGAQIALQREAVRTAITTRFGNCPPREMNDLCDAVHAVLNELRKGERQPASILSAKGIVEEEEASIGGERVSLESVSQESATATGYHHRYPGDLDRESQQPCQDAAISTAVQHGEREYRIVVVSDGVSEALHSDLGAELLATTAAHLLRTSCLREEAPDFSSPAFQDEFYAELVTTVVKEVGACGVAPQHFSKLLSATLLCGVLDNREFTAFGLGDGGLLLGDRYLPMENFDGRNLLPDQTRRYPATVMDLIDPLLCFLKDGVPPAEIPTKYRESLLTQEAITEGLSSRNKRTFEQAMDSFLRETALALTPLVRMAASEVVQVNKGVGVSTDWAEKGFVDFPDKREVFLSQPDDEGGERIVLNRPALLQRSAQEAATFLTAFGKLLYDEVPANLERSRYEVEQQEILIWKALSEKEIWRKYPQMKAFLEHLAEKEPAAPIRCLGALRGSEEERTYHAQFTAYIETSSLEFSRAREDFDLFSEIDEARDSIRTDLNAQLDEDSTVQELKERETTEREERRAAFIERFELTEAEAKRLSPEFVNGDRGDFRPPYDDFGIARIR
ncbi:protein phosphatase 2C domain-containing protein [bacterium]|nr:protein phosphatase 2C domain-containing protein [bacterium]